MTGSYRGPIDFSDPNEQYDINAEYIVICDGEAIFPYCIDGILDLWTAETVCEFIKMLCPDKVVTMQAVKFVDEETTKRTTSHNLRVL